MAIAPPKTVKDVITDFLATAPSVEQIINYRLPDELQQHALDLLDRLREGTLTPEERLEVEEYRELDHLMTIIKAKAHLQLRG
jgi:hypothetical protein